MAIWPLDWTDVAACRNSDGALFYSSDSSERKEDRLEVRIKRLSELKSSDPEVQKKILPGTIKSNLQLAGRYEDTPLTAKLKLREVTKISLEADKSSK